MSDENDLTARVRFRIGFAAAGLLILAGCATAGKLAGKAAWFAIDTSVRIAATTAHGVSRVAGIETRHALNLTKDVATQLWAQEESQKIARLFWHYAEIGAYQACYDLLSDDLKKKLPFRKFREEAEQWAGRIRLVQILPGIVRPTHVEIPTEIEAPADQARSAVHLYLAPVKAAWKILSWTVQSP